MQRTFVSARYSLLFVIRDSVVVSTYTYTDVGDGVICLYYQSNSEYLIMSPRQVHPLCQDEPAGELFEDATPDSEEPWAMGFFSLSPSFLPCVHASQRILHHSRRPVIEVPKHVPGPPRSPPCGGRRWLPPASGSRLLLLFLSFSRGIAQVK